MTHISPTVYASWAVLSVTLFGFLISHLWKFDRFECLRFGGDRQSGAFKRMMTYTYLISLPLLIVYSIGMMTIKYREGYSVLPGYGIIPKPYQLWTPTDQALLMKFYLIFAVAWGLEIVTHLEELCFWFFLVHVGPSHSTWFGSIHFKIWAVGSVLGVVGMPLVTWFTRSDTLRCEAWTILAGSISSLVITLGGLRILFVFPRFLRTVKSAGGEPEVVIRLTTFHDLNVIRVILRFVFCVPLLILAVDGLSGHEHHINESALGTDLLASLGGVGMVSSSCLTLLIFFPRSVAREAGYRPGRRSTGYTGNEISLEPIELENGRSSEAAPVSQAQIDTNPFAAKQAFPPPPHARPHTYDPTSLVGEYGHDVDYPTTDGISPPPNYYSDHRTHALRTSTKVQRQEIWEMVTSPTQIHLPNNTTTPAASSTHLAAPGANTLGSSISFDSRTLITGPSRPRRPQLHPMLMNYSSPINVTQRPTRNLHRPRNAV